MNDDETFDRSPLPSAQPSRPPHLSGEALKQWYLDNPPLTEEDRQQAIKRQREKQEATAWVWLMAIGMLVALSHVVIDDIPVAALLGPATAGVIGVWLAIGRANLLVRSLIALALVASMGVVHAPYRSFLLACALLTAMMTCGTLLVATSFGRARTQRLRFTLLDIAGAILLAGCSLALTQKDAFALLDNLSRRSTQESLMVLFSFSGSTVLASLPVLVLKRYRDGTLFKISAWLVLAVAPLGTTAAFWVLEAPVNYQFIMGTWLVYVFDVALVWGLVFPLDVVGAFRDEVDPPSTTTEAEAGHWEELE